MSNKNNSIIVKLNEINNEKYKNDNELQIFKEFEEKHLKIINEKDYYICSHFNMSNINSNDSSSREYDIYFINYDKSKELYWIFLCEIKDYSKTKFSFFKCLKDWNILKQNLFLTKFIIPMYNEKINWIKCNIIKNHNNQIKPEYFIFDNKENQNFWNNSIDICSYWKSISQKDVFDILEKTESCNLKNKNLETLKRESYNDEFIRNLLENNDNKLIEKTVISIDNINKLQKEKLDNKNLIVINGTPGSGKTVLAILMFITAENITFIVNNKDFWGKNKNLINHKYNKNKFVYYISPEDNKQEIPTLKFCKESKIIIIDEYQNIDISQLKIIIDYCKNKNKQLILLGGFEQNIYSWKNQSYGNWKLNYEELKKYIKEIYPSNEEDNESKFEEITWDNSNRINKTDLNKIKYLVYDDNNKLNEYLKNKDKSFLKIEKCESSNEQNIKKRYSEKIPILFVSSHNDQEKLTTYKYIGSEHKEIIVYFSKDWVYDKEKNMINTSKKQKEELIYSLLFVTFTRATLSIKIFVDEENKFKDEICGYFNNKLINLKEI